MKAISIICLFFCFSTAFSQSLERVQQSIDSLRREEFEFITNYQKKMKSYQKQLDSLEHLREYSKHIRIKELIDSMNLLIGKGVKVPLKIISFLSPAAELVTKAPIIQPNENVTLIHRSYSYCFVEVLYKKQKGFVPVTKLVLPEKLSLLEKKIMWLMSNDEYTPPQPKTTSQTSPTDTYSSSPSYSSPKTRDCSSVQCSGTTKKGSRCRNTTTSCSGRCYLH